MPANFNPFDRSRMKIVEPLQLISAEYDGTTREYHLEYRATRSAAQVGLLQKQFRSGTPLIVNGTHVVVREANFTHTNSTVDEVTIRVVAVIFSTLLEQLSANQKPPHTDNQPPESIPGALKIPNLNPTRRILK